MVRISDVADATVIRFSAISVFNTPPSLDSLFPKKYSAGSECVVKAPGESFTVNSVTALGFPSFLSFPITFAGQLKSAGGPAPWQYPTYEWTVNETLNRDFSLNGSLIHVDGLWGIQESSVLAAPNFHGDACDGTPRTFRTLMAWIRSLGDGGIVPGPDLTLRLTVDGVPMDVIVSLISFWGYLGLDQKNISTVPIPPNEGVIILTPGIRIDTSGSVISHGHVRGVPPGPLPFESALHDAIVSLALTKASALIQERTTRVKSQRMALETALARVEKALTSLD
ncbi:MAG TPA: hypothetical protein VK511_01280 [Gemmatimonadaceae bacterium]|nr:hypothetical protein [Gemmatimonadaceae bacterium]